MKFQVVGFFVHQQQAARFGVENLHRVFGDQPQQAVHVTHFGGQPVRDFVDGGQLPGTKLRLFEQLQLVDGARGQVRNIPEQILLLVGEGDARLGRRGDHHAQHPTGIGQQRDAQPGAQVGILRRSVRIAGQRLAHVVVGAQRLLRARDFADQVAAHPPAPSLFVKVAILALVVEHVVQLAGIAVAQGDEEARRIDHAHGLRVDQFEQGVEVDGEVQRAAHLAQHVLHADAAFQVVHRLGTLDRERDLVTQALDEARIFEHVGGPALARANRQKAVQSLLAAQPDDNRSAQHGQPSPVAHHVRRQFAPFFQVQQGRALAQVAHQAAFRQESDVGNALPRRGIFIGAVFVGDDIAYVQDRVRGGQRIVQQAMDQPGDVAQAHRLGHIARELLQVLLVMPPGAEIDRIDPALEVDAQRVEQQRHDEDRRHDQHRTQRRVARGSSDHHRDRRHHQPVRQRQQRQQRAVECGLRDHPVRIDRAELQHGVHGAQGQQDREHLVEHDHRRVDFLIEHGETEPDQHRDQHGHQADDHHRALVTGDGRGRARAPPVHPHHQRHRPGDQHAQRQHESRRVQLEIAGAEQHDTAAAERQRDQDRRGPPGGHLLHKGETVGKFQRQHSHQPRRQPGTDQPRPGIAVGAHDVEVSAQKDSQHGRQHRHKPHVGIVPPPPEDHRADDPQRHPGQPADAKIAEQIAQRHFAQADEHAAAAEAGQIAHVYALGPDRLGRAGAVIAQETDRHTPIPFLLAQHFGQLFDPFAHRQRAEIDARQPVQPVAGDQLDAFHGPGVILADQRPVGANLQVAQRQKSDKRLVVPIQGRIGVQHQQHPGRQEGKQGQAHHDSLALDSRI